MRDDRLALLDTIQLVYGSHASPEDGMCVMEAAAWLAGEPFGDHPTCVSPVLGDFLRSWNDAFDDQTRQQLHAYIPRLLNTAGDEAADTRRREMAWDWILRTWLPAWLRLAKLDDAAVEMESRGEAGLPRAQRDAAAARDAARTDASADAAASAAAWAAARDAAWAAAANAADASAAAWDALMPTVLLLKESAFDLLDRLIEAAE